MTIQSRLLLGLLIVWPVLQLTAQEENCDCNQANYPYPTWKPSNQQIGHNNPYWVYREGRCVPYEPCGPNVPGRPCASPCGATEPAAQPCVMPDCCPPYTSPCPWPYEFYGCGPCCVPCQPALRVYAGPRYSDLRVHSFLLEQEILDPTVTPIVDLFEGYGRRHATMGGLQGGIRYRARGKLYGQVEGFWEGGEVKTRRAIDRLRKWQRWQLVGRLGGVLAVGCHCQVLFIPYSGYGFRWFQDRYPREVFDFPDATNPDTFIFPDIRFLYQQYFVPFGLAITLLSGGCFEIGVLFEYDVTVCNQLKIVIADQEPGTDETASLQFCRWKLSRKAGWLIEVPVTLKLGICCVQLDVTLIPFYQASRFGSGLVTDFLGGNDVFIDLPKHPQIDYGARLEIGFRV